MAEEFVINSPLIETKINQLLPSQGGFQPGVDFSASTMVIPIIDVTESAEGSVLRQDLQSSFSHGSITSFNVANTTTTIINTTGYFRVFGTCSGTFAGGSTTTCQITLGDGSTDKVIYSQLGGVGFNSYFANNFDFLVFLKASDVVKVTSGGALLTFKGATRQIADISGNLVNPT
jgi:hypothetical protein